MKEPQHRPTPAFDQARDEREAWRKQQIAALTPAQRQDYERRDQNETKHVEAEKKRLDDTRRQRIEQDMLRRLNDPALKPNMSWSQRERQARQAAITHVTNQDRATIERANHAKQERLDSYLRQAARERQEKAQSHAEQGRKDFSEAARDRTLKRAFDRAGDRKEPQHQRDQPQKSAAREFDRAANPGALTRAFAKAKQQPNRQQTHTHGRNHQQGHD